MSEYQKSLVISILEDKVKELIAEQVSADKERFMDLEHIIPEICDAIDYIEYGE